MGQRVRVLEGPPAQTMFLVTSSDIEQAEGATTGASSPGVRSPTPQRRHCMRTKSGTMGMVVEAMEVPLGGRQLLTGKHRSTAG